MRLMIVDDHRLILVGLRQLLESYPDIDIVGAADDGDTACQMAIDVEPDIVLMDLQMKAIDGADATRAIKRALPGCRVMVLTSSDGYHDITAAMDAGADGYLLKDSDPDLIVDGLRSCLAGGMPLSPTVAAQLVRRGPRLVPAPTDELTRRELEILGHILDGRTNQDIADALQISEKTVKGHCSSLFQRIGVTSRTQAAMWATQHLPRTNVQGNRHDLGARSPAALRASRNAV